MAQRKQDELRKKELREQQDEQDSEMGGSTLLDNKLKSHVGCGVSETGSTVLKDPNVDTEMTVNKEQSNVTSNIDSVYSFLGGKKAEVEDSVITEAFHQNELEAALDEPPKKEKKAQEASHVDLRLLNAEINASMHSENSIARIKRDAREEKSKKKRVAKVGAMPSAEKRSPNQIDNNDNQQAGHQKQFFSFIQKNADGTKKKAGVNKISSRNFIAAINQKYTDEDSFATNAAPDSFLAESAVASEFTENAVVRSGEFPETATPTSAFIVSKKSMAESGLHTPSASLFKQSGGSSAKVIGSGVLPKKLHQGVKHRGTVDVRYQLKSLEEIDDGDFLSGNSGPVKRPSPVQDSPPSGRQVGPQGSSHGKRPQPQTGKSFLSPGMQQANKLLGSPVSAKNSPYQEDRMLHHSYLSLPQYSRDILISEIQPTKRLKRLGGFNAQVKSFLLSHSEDSVPASGFCGSDNIFGQVVAIEKRRGINTLVCSKTDEADMEKAQSEMEIKKELLSKNTSVRQSMDGSVTASVRGSVLNSVRGSEKGSEKGSPIKSELRSESSKLKALKADIKNKTYFKVLLNPILTKLDVAIGDLVHMIGAHQHVELMSTLVQEETKSQNNQSNHIQFLIVPQFITNLTEHEDDDKSTISVKKSQHSSAQGSGWKVKRLYKNEQLSSKNNSTKLKGGETSGQDTEMESIQNEAQDMEFPGM